VAILFLQSKIAKAQMTTITVPGTSNPRTMLVYAPSGLAENRPLMISMHGMNQDIAYQRTNTMWENVADTAKFVVVYPQGENQSWDIAGMKDINFILEIIEQMVTRYDIDRTRVYLSGFSMGGMLTYHAASNISDKIAAFAPVSCQLFNTVYNNSRPIPIINTIGDADDVFPYNASLLNYYAGWRTKLKCPTDAVVTRPATGVTVSTWAPCDCNTEYVLVTLAGKGHHPSNDANYNSAAGIWNFVRKYSTESGCDNGLPVVKITSPTSSTAFTAPATVEIEATATVTEGTITKVEFYNGTTLLGEDLTAPYTFTWEDVEVGEYSITAVATDDSDNESTSTPVAIKVNVPQGPYNQIAHNIPGTIQAEEFDLGGNGVAYSDDSPGSSVTPVVDFRTDEDVDIEVCTDVDEGYNLGFTTAGEWVEYTVDVEEAGTYKLDLRVACDGDGRSVILSMDGTNITEEIEIPNTGGWQTWETVTIDNVALSAGEQVLRLEIGAMDYVNINYMTFTSLITSVNKGYSGNSISVYPNPFENSFIVDNDGEYNYKLYDMSGRILRQGTGNGEPITGTALQNGLYLLEVQNISGSQFFKIQKK